MIRNVIGSILALAGATAAVWSPFRAWYDGRHGSAYRIDDLFGGITDEKAEVIGSILLPFAFAALVTLVGLLLRSRLLVALAGVIVLGFTVLWMVRAGQAEDGLTVGSDGTGLGDGVANALGGGALLLLASVVMSGRRRAHTTRVDHRPPPTHPDLDGRGGQGGHGGYGDQDGYGDQGGYGGEPDARGPGGAPAYPHDADSPTRTMDQPRWDEHDPRRDEPGPGQGGHGPYPDEPPPPRQRP
ncbi:hypothetical protein J7E93_31455 [Streptomyces sp. ISL-36]|uniref:hypothetical protein n=1 Tax=Streptomyces sp. ISL-36 TaxID=2819182 RepID=UPI001BE6A593|nr:hypothetical protein [Streptomyces sp. ISL-36]MBT2444535.1 hypothetical protein [Streptomyces sp. ISL-36]